jgi:hypothetical protein
MWEANVRTTVCAILADLRQVKPNFETMVSTVNDLAVEVGIEKLPRRVEPGAATPMMNQKACDICTELESLQTALSKRDALNPTRAHINRHVTGCPPPLTVARLRRL